MLDDIIFTFIARAGGGGSGGGGSGGGGGFSGGSGGSDSGEGIILAFPALIAGGVAGFAKKKTRSKWAAFWIGSVVGLVFSLLYLIIGGIFWFLLAIVSTLVGAYGGVSFDRLSVFRKNSKSATTVVHQASATDSMWQPQYIIDYATQVFNRFQYDWSNLDSESIRKYTTQRYANHVGLMLYALHQMGRRNIMDKVKIEEIIFTNAHDDIDDKSDRVSVGFLTQAEDRLVDVATGKDLSYSNEEFAEQWNFVREDNIWKLDSINQSTENESMLVKTLRQFAEDNQMYFSLDWGKLLLPTRGQLFRPSKFSNTDVNNHIIGFWEGGILVQLYTCGVRTGNGFTDEGPNKDMVYYLIGQIALPKSYGGILIERDNNILKKMMSPPKGYKKVKLEWGDFNKHYRVCATDTDKVTSFELLNPSFMAWLYDQDIKVNIEVVDNVVYLYAKLSQEEQRYAEMLEILKRSHKELKM